MMQLVSETATRFKVRNRLNVADNVRAACRISNGCWHTTRVRSPLRWRLTTRVRRPSTATRACHPTPRRASTCVACDCCTLTSGTRSIRRSLRLRRCLFLRKRAHPGRDHEASGLEPCHSIRLRHCAAARAGGFCARRLGCHDREGQGLDRCRGDLLADAHAAIPVPRHRLCG